MMRDEDEQPAALRPSHSSSQKTEFDFIASLRQRVASTSLKSESLIAGIGDDAAVFRSSANKETVITADLLVEDVDFRRTTTPPYLLGHKALAVSLSVFSSVLRRVARKILSLSPTMLMVKRSRHLCSTNSVVHSMCSQ